MSLNLNQHVGKPYDDEKVLTAYLLHSCINIHVTFTAQKLLLIIILGLVYNKYTIPCLGALSEAFLVAGILITVTVVKYKSTI
jgi:hypothetical protein